MLSNALIEQLKNTAFEAAENSYSPYSGFRVGAALLCADGSVYKGTNVENSSYSATVCAERSAFISAVSDGKREFKAIAIVGGRGEAVGKTVCCPCGVCLQMLSELCGGDFLLVLPSSDGDEIKSLSELLPCSFKL